MIYCVEPCFFVQHPHIENIKTVANLTNNKDVFMCILRFHARAGYLQTYETLLDQLKSHPDSDQVLQDQYDVETHALADRNFNVPCELGIRYPSLVAMLNRREMMWRPSVIIYYVYTAIYLCMKSISTDIHAMCTGKHEEFYWLCKPSREPSQTKQGRVSARTFTPFDCVRRKHIQRVSKIHMTPYLYVT